MSAGGVIPPAGERLPQGYVQTGSMDTGSTEILFGAQGHSVLITAGDFGIALFHEDQDTFVRQLFRAITLAEQGTGPVEAPF